MRFGDRINSSKSSTSSLNPSVLGVVEGMWSSGRIGLSLFLAHLFFATRECPVEQFMYKIVNRKATGKLKAISSKDSSSTCSSRGSCPAAGPCPQSRELWDAADAAQPGQKKARGPLIAFLAGPMQGPIPTASSESRSTWFVAEKRSNAIRKHITGCWWNPVTYATPPGTVFPPHTVKVSEMERRQELQMLPRRISLHIFVLI